MSEPGRPVIVVSAKSPGVAVLLELVFGLTFQTFGVGNLYAGNIGVGLALMFGYWFASVVNFLLCFVLIGFVTWPLTWIAVVITACITAHGAAVAQNQRYMTGRL